MALIDTDSLQRVQDMAFLNGAGITEYFRPGRIATLDFETQTYLLAGSETTGVGMIDVAGTGALTFEGVFGHAYDLLETFRFENPGIETFETSQGQFVYLTGAGQSLVNNVATRTVGIHVVEISASGVPDLIQTIRQDDVSDGFGVVSSFGVDPTFANVAGRDIMIVNARENSGNFNAFQTYQVRDNGTLKPLAKTATEFDSASKFDVASVGNRDFVVTWGYFEAAPMQVLRLFKSGEMRQVYNLPTSETAIYNRITTDLETVTIGGRSFLIASEVTVGSIMVYEIDRNGTLTLVDQETPGRDDPWGGPEALEVFTEGGNHYLAAGGYGNALAVFQISNGGALTEVEELTPPNSAPLGRVYDIEAQDIDGKQFLFASTGAVDELRSLRFVAEDDRISGNRNDNVRRGDSGDDQIFGKGGNDTLRGRDGDDMIDGGTGNDRVLGMADDDHLRGNDGNDRVDGGAGNDFLFGDDGDDLLLGRDGNDRMYGGAGADRLVGHDGTDVMDGGAGNDRLIGGNGLDRLTDGAGADRMTGGPGLVQDVFIFVQDGRRDVITDYQDGLDKIDLTAFGDTLGFTDLVIAQKGANVTLAVMGETILVKGADGPLSQFDLDQGDFIFA